MKIRALSKICLSVPLILLLCAVSYAPIVAADVPPLEATMISLDHQNFPFIYLSVAVARFGEGISTLTRSNFQVTENGNLQTDYFDVIPPETGGGVRAVDIVFLMDNSGSMDVEQNTVRDNVEAFVDELVARGVDCQLGLCRFGAWENSGNPIIEDNGTLTSNADYFKNTVWNRNVASGGFEPGWDALYEAVTSFAFRGGAQKVFILITDETPTDNGNVGTHTQEEAIAILKDHFVTTFALIELSDAHAISDYGEIAQQTNGEYYDILEPLDGILDYISNLIANNYRITYKSSRPVFDGVERHVVVTVSYSGDQATCEGTYIPGSAPRIQRTQDTLDLHGQSWAAGTQFNIRAEITDAVAPYVQSATVYYRRTGDADYTPTAMTHSSDIWAGTIPGGAVSSPGVDYYISATDGQSTVTDPSVDPRTSPHQLAILPNEAPRITHTPPVDVPINTPVAITAEIIDTTNALASARLHYRKTGQLIYECNGEMTNTAGDSYRDSIPSDYVTAAGVEYYILAVDDLGVGNYHGTPDVPYVVSVFTNPPPNTKIETTEIDESNGTAKFTWSGSDDTTPEASLVYSYRLVRPGPAYDAWSSWSTGKTKTYTGLSAGSYKFQVRAKDADEAIDPSPASEEFEIGEAPLTCVINLRPQGAGPSSMGVIGDFQTFDIYVGDSTGGITQVRFSSDDSVDRSPSGEWTEWFDWGSSPAFSLWDADAKTMVWSFTTGGNKEVCAEIKDGDGNGDKAYAYILVQVPEWREDIQLGDILYAPRAISGIGHVGIYVGYGLTADPGWSSITHRITSWDDREEAFILRVDEPFETRAEAARLALQVAAHDAYTYDWRWVQKNPDLDATWWYCSELVWAVYWNLGVNVEWNLGNSADLYLPGPVEPYDIYRDADTDIVNAHCRGVTGCCNDDCYVARPPGSFNLFSPADMVVTDPDGLIVSKSTCTIPGAVYLEREPPGEDDPEDKIYIPELKTGVYTVLVEPEAGANEIEVFSLTFYHQGRELVLADEVLVGDIPGIPYRVTISQGTVSPGNDPPEVSLLSPSSTDVVVTILCQVRWYATDPDDPAEALAINLYWSGDGGATWTGIVSDLENNGAYNWDIAGLPKGEYWLRVVATDPAGASTEAMSGPFTISTFEGTVIIGPNPVTDAGTTFFYTLPDGTSTTKLMIFNVTGRLLFETPLDVNSTRFPSAGTWNPVDQNGVPLANGPYVYILIADGKVIGQGKMVIQR